ncbi:hypothetical protein F3Y22_tig00110160pilonHSYRG00339 [Hibiscus syriacus]|uniref:ACT domain-containing protein ACR n=1 Tax=Hibiscus syriacus TaxID=106335 RepID=A0A6A3BIK0_HIBSY|nr:hypothetical protein F3Y22_tig00110160pilonHSYRG00339 [Hibiscus syriacus]
MEIVYQPFYTDPEFQSLIERIHPPSANKHGFAGDGSSLTDLDLVISKSYISSDGGWLMDGQSIFPPYHYTSRNKVTDENLIVYIQQALSDTRRRGGGFRRNYKRASNKRDLRSFIRIEMPCYLLPLHGLIIPSSMHNPYRRWPQGRADHGSETTGSSTRKVESVVDAHHESGEQTTSGVKAAMEAADGGMGVPDSCDDRGLQRKRFDTQSEREELARCLIAATERRVSDVSVIKQANFCFLLLVLEILYVTRVFRENGLTITRAEIGTQGRERPDLSTLRMLRGMKQI